MKRSGAMHANNPRCLAEHVAAYVPFRSLRSADQALVVNFGQRGFSCTGPSL